MKIIGSICAKHPELNGQRRGIRRKFGWGPAHCIGCERDYKKKSYSKWKARSDKTNKLYRERPENIAKARQRTNQWRQSNPEIFKLSKQKWREKNPDKCNAATIRHTAAKLKAIPRWANHEAIGCYYEFATLKTKLTEELWEVDHIVPLQSKKVCGLHTDWNLKVIHHIENRSKGNRVWPDMPT